MPNPTEQRYDAVIFEISTRTVTNVVGRSLPLIGGFHTIGKRLDTMQGRLNEHFDVRAVPTGTCDVGHPLPPDDDPMWEPLRALNLL